MKFSLTENAFFMYYFDTLRMQGGKRDEASVFGIIDTKFDMGNVFLFIKLLVVDLGVWGVVFWRCAFGAGTLLVILLVQRKLNTLRKLPLIPILFIALLNNALPWALIAVSETTISSSMASVVNATTPIWTILIGFTIFASQMKKCSG